MASSSLPSASLASNSTNAGLPNPTLQPFTSKLVTEAGQKSIVGIHPQIVVQGLSSHSQFTNAGTKRKSTEAGTDMEVPSAPKKAKRIKMSMLGQPVDLEEY